ncbi:MAG TPA: lysophospholipid acyltransferase family protein, partial [Vicinamibacterales bacterium]|nr:lysophospholipid acyltransferase family protein [Vicinamibacterales bacterium]
KRTGADFDTAWARKPLAVFTRRVILSGAVSAAERTVASPQLHGLDRLADLRLAAMDAIDDDEQPPAVIFAANHQSHLDTPAILDALPPRWRYRVAPAMAKEFFKAHFHPEGFSRTRVAANRLNYYLASLFFNAFPLPQRETGTRQTLRYIGDLVGSGYSILIYPEGKRTDAGEIKTFQPGAAMIAARLEVPVVPVRLDGLDRILHQTWKFPARGVARVAFGAPMSLKGNDYVALSRQVEEAVRGL